MKDFTVHAYRGYLQAIQRSFPQVLRFVDYFRSKPTPDAFCLLRHDVDRKPQNALNMARLEHELGLRATYYFRTKPHTFQPDLIREIAALGHEIGYHYECLSDTRGNMTAAMKDFATHLERLRAVTPVHTICMHGRPLLPHDNRDMWRDPQRHHQLREDFDILGEVYLDIDYREIMYISDTGRNWQADRFNKRDKVASNYTRDFTDGDALHAYLTAPDYPRLIFMTHPERWSDQPLEYITQWGEGWRHKPDKSNPMKTLIVVSTGRCGTVRLTQILQKKLPPSITVVHQMPWSRLANVVGNMLYHTRASETIKLRLYDRLTRDFRQTEGFLCTDPLTAMILPKSVVEGEAVKIVHVTREPAAFARSMFRFSRSRWPSWVAHNLVPLWQPGLWPLENWLNPRILTKYEQVAIRKNQFFRDEYGANPHYQAITMDEMFRTDRVQNLVNDWFGTKIDITAADREQRANQSRPTAS